MSSYLYRILLSTLGILRLGHLIVQILPFLNVQIKPHFLWKAIPAHTPKHNIKLSPLWSISSLTTVVFKATTVALAFNHQFKKLATFFVLVQIVNILGFVGHAVCYCSPAAPETICKWMGIVLCTDKTLFIEQVRPRDYNLIFLIHSLALLSKVFICALFIYYSITLSGSQRQESLLDVPNALFPTSLSLAPGSVHIC